MLKRVDLVKAAKVLRSLNDKGKLLATDKHYLAEKVIRSLRN